MSIENNDMDKIFSELTHKIATKSAQIAVIGLGYVGLPLVVEFVKINFPVFGIDISEEKVAKIQNGRSDITDVTDKEVENILRSGFYATTDYAELTKADVISICVPTPLNKTKDPDVSYILTAVEGIKRYIKTGQLIVLESTTYPGTTEELILPILEETGKKVGVDFFLAFSPERVDPGNQVYNIQNTPKVVGGITPACTECIRLLYSQMIDLVVPMSSSRAAEMVKLLENTFRSVNIALVNEITLMCDRLGIDVWEVIDAAATKPFGFMPFYPGPGLGGHCIPIDPFYLSWKLKTLNYYARFIELSGDINSNMPAHVVEKITDMLNDYQKSVNGSKILILGVAYKKDINDVRESPAIDIIKLLQAKGATVDYNDPHVATFRLNGTPVHSVELSESNLRNYDGIVITTEHSAYDFQFIAKHAPLIFDSRNALKGIREYSEKIYKL